MPPTSAGPAELPPEYYAQYVEAAERHWWFKGREAILRTLVARHVTLDRDALIVDLGSGPGGPTRRLFPTQRIVGLDLSARVLAAYSSANGAVVADAGRLPFRPDSVPAICAFDVLEHLADDVAAVARWHEVLIPGGTLVATVPAYNALWSESDEVDRHYRRYVKSSLNRCLKTAGFRIVRSSYFNTVLLPGVALVKWIERMRPKAAATPGRNAELEIRLPAPIEATIARAFAAESLWLRSHDLPAGVSIVTIARKA